MPVDYAGLTYKEIRAQVHAVVLDVYPDRIDDDLVKLWVQQGHLEIDRRLRWTRTTDTITTTAADRDYAREAQWREIVAVTYDSDDYKIIQEIDFEDYLRRYAESQVAGTPGYWATWGEFLYFYPTPDTTSDTITLYLVVPPVAMALDADVPSFNVELHWLIVDYALAKAYFHLQDINTANNYYSKFYRDLSEWEDSIEGHRNRNISVAPTWPAHT